MSPTPLLLLFLLVLVAQHTTCTVQQLLLTRSASQGLVLLFVAAPPAPISSFVVLYGPASAPLSLSAVPTQSFSPPLGSSWNATVVYTPLGATDLEAHALYSYAVADAASGGAVLLSPVHFAPAPPDTGDDVHLVALANMGVAGEARSVLAAVERHALLQAEPPVSALLLPGDLAFAGQDDAEAVLDRWAAQLSESLGSRVPVLTGVGHAELADGTGEAYLTRLGRAMPNASAASPLWYSTRLGAVHLVAIATELPLDPSSDQYAWLRADLAQAAEARRTGDVHFIVLMGHTPLYSSSARANRTHAAALREAVGALLSEAEVEVALWSHVAAYERTAPLDTPTGRLQANGTVHLSLGSGGRPLDDEWLAEAAEWSAYREAALGFVALTAFHNGSLHIQFVRVNGSHADSHWLHHTSNAAPAGPVLLVATLSSLIIIGAAVVVVLLLMRRLGKLPAQHYDELKQLQQQEQEQEEKQEQQEKGAL